MIPNCEIRNIKGAFQIKSDNIYRALKKIEAKVTFHGNCAVIRLKYIYIIFWSASYVNVTKLKSRENFAEAIKLFEEATDLQCFKEITVHNIVATGSFVLDTTLSTIHAFIRGGGGREKIFVKSTFNRSFFPSLLLRFKNLGTCVLYQSGKFAYLGVKNTDNFTHLGEHIDWILNQLPKQDPPTLRRSTPRTGIFHHARF